VLLDSWDRLADATLSRISSNLYDGRPVGFAFTDYRSGVSELHSQWAQTQEALAGGDTWVRRPTVTRLRLTALDRQSLVLLGDPTVTVPALDG
jgi:hypothetical protein